MSVSNSTSQADLHAQQHNTSEAVEAAHEARLDSVEKRVTKVETSKAGPKGDKGDKGEDGKDGTRGTAGTDGVDGRDGFPRPSGGKDGDAIVKDGDGTKWATISGDGTDNEAVHYIHKTDGRDGYSDNDMVTVDGKTYVALKTTTSKTLPTGAQTTPSGTPGPASVTVSGSNGQVNVDWPAVGGAQSYNVYAADGTTLLGSTTAPGYVNIRPTAKKADSYEVSAVTGGVESNHTSSDGGDGSAWRLIGITEAGDSLPSGGSDRQFLGLVSGTPVWADVLPSTATDGQVLGWVNGEWSAVDAPKAGSSSSAGPAVPYSTPGTYFPTEPKFVVTPSTGSGYQGRQNAVPVYVAEDTPIDRIGQTVRGSGTYVVGLRAVNADHTPGPVLWTAGSYSAPGDSNTFVEIAVDQVIPAGWSFFSIENAPGTNGAPIAMSGFAQSLLISETGSDSSFLVGAGACGWYTYDFAASGSSLAAAYVSPKRAISAPLVWFRRKA